MEEGSKVTVAVRYLTKNICLMKTMPYNSVFTTKEYGQNNEVISSRHQPRQFCKRFSMIFT